MVSTWQGPPAMKSLFTRMFCCKSCPNIVKTNNFINFQSYFLQKVQKTHHTLLRVTSVKYSYLHLHTGLQLHSLSFCLSLFSCQTMPVAMALLRDVQNLCPKDVLNFILDLIKYNDNRKNKVNTHNIHFAYDMMTV